MRVACRPAELSESPWAWSTEVACTQPLQAHCHTMRLGSTAKVLANCMRRVLKNLRVCHRQDCSRKRMPPVLQLAAVAAVHRNSSWQVMVLSAVHTAGCSRCPKKKVLKSLFLKSFAEALHATQAQHPCCAGVAREGLLYDVRTMERSHWHCHARGYLKGKRSQSLSRGPSFGTAHRHDHIPHAAIWGGQCIRDWLVKPLWDKPLRPHAAQACTVTVCKEVAKL